MDGWYRLDRRIPGVGRIRIKSGRSLAMHRRVDALVTKLAEQGVEELPFRVLVDPDWDRLRRCHDPPEARSGE